MYVCRAMQGWVITTDNQDIIAGNTSTNYMANNCSMICHPFIGYSVPIMKWQFPQTCILHVYLKGVS